MTKNVKNRHLSNLEAKEWGKNQIIKNSRINLLENPMKMLHAKFQAISMNILGSISLLSNLLTYFLVQIYPKNFRFCLSNCKKMTILAEKLTANLESAT